MTHDQVTEPKLTKEQSHGERRPRPHVTCLDCGREFWYDWVRMRRLDERRQTALPAVSPRRAA